MPGQDVRVSPSGRRYISIAGVNAGASAAINVGEGFTPMRLICPASTVSTAFTFTECTTEGGTYIETKVLNGSGGAAYTITASASDVIPLDVTVMKGIGPFIKIVGNGNDTGITFTLICDPLV